MNNSNSSPFNDWLILLSIALVLTFLAYGLARLVWKVCSLLYLRKRTANIVDMSNVVPLSPRRKKMERLN